jgi:UPF0288 family protein (methanogenesis marker protein 3)
MVVRDPLLENSQLEKLNSSDVNHLNIPKEIDRSHVSSIHEMWEKSNIYEEIQMNFKWESNKTLKNRKFDRDVSPMREDVHFDNIEDLMDHPGFSKIKQA